MLSGNYCNTTVAYNYNKCVYLLFALLWNTCNVVVILGVVTELRRIALCLMDVVIIGRLVDL